MSAVAARGHVLQFHRDAAKTKIVATFERQGFVADVFHNPDHQPPIWQLIFTRAGDPEILYWRQERSLEDAEVSARNLLRLLAVREALG